MPTTMNTTAPSTLADFRTEVRSFFDQVLPAALDGVEGTSDRGKAWRASLFDHGLAAIDYPTDCGGRGLSGPPTGVA